MSSLAGCCCGQLTGDPEASCPQIAVANNLPDLLLRGRQLVEPVASIWPIRGYSVGFLARIGELVTGAVADWIGGNEQSDDVTTVLARAR